MLSAVTEPPKSPADIQAVLFDFTGVLTTSPWPSNSPTRRPAGEAAPGTAGLTTARTARAAARIGTARGVSCMRPPSRGGRAS